LPVVEFLGVPGSGKTTLAAALVAARADAHSLEDSVRIAIARTGSDRVTRLAARLTRRSSGRLFSAAYARSSDRLSALVRFATLHPEALQSVLAAQSARADRDRDPDVVLGWVINLMARYQLATEPGISGWLVIDEGFAQRALALFAAGWSTDDEPELLAYLESVPRPDVLVLVDLPAEVAVGRLGGRGWSERLTQADDRTRRGFLDAAGVVAARVADVAAGAGGVVTRGSGEAPVPDSVDLIAATLSGRTKPASPGD